MKIVIIATGKIKAGPEKELAEDYMTRTRNLGRKAGVTSLSVLELAESQRPTPAERMAEEAKSVFAALHMYSQYWVLDERGKSLSSTAFTADLRRLIDSGVSSLAFVIGGPDGNAQPVRDKANRMISFGDMTWPHRLARVMLTEQIYRSVTILAGHPYHRA